MAENSKIEWTDHTFNPWIGCAKVSPGCKYCYAESLSTRYGWTKWGPQGDRKRTSEANWRKPLAWNRQAEREGRRYRVFCASLADVFEDNPQVIGWRLDLWELIAKTEYLDWLLLTKRPKNVNVPDWITPLPNVWIGTSIENQKTADKRIPELLKIPAKIRFLSCEPLLEPVDLGRAYPCGYYCDEVIGHADHPFWTPGINTGIDWIIVGGESGPQARPFDLAWAEELIVQGNEAGIPVFIKQLGSNPIDGLSGQKSGYPITGKGGDMAEWPAALRVREMPVVTS